MGMTLFQFDTVQFYQPFVLNAITPARMLIGTTNLYESLNRGDSLTNLGPLGALVSNSQGYGQAMAYGSRLAGLPVPDVFYVGAGATISHRVTAAGAITKLASYPGGTVITIVMNPNNYKQVYVSDINNKVWGSSDEGTTWVDLTGNLPSLTGLVTTIEVLSPDATVGTTTLFAGGFGVFQLTNPSTIGGTWTPVTGPPPPASKSRPRWSWTSTSTPPISFSWPGHWGGEPGSSPPRGRSPSRGESCQAAPQQKTCRRRRHLAYQLAKTCPCPPTQ
jgi:hypothetical protein